MLCIKFLILVIVVLFAYTVGYYAVDVYDISSNIWIVQVHCI